MKYLKLLALASLLLTATLSYGQVPDVISGLTRGDSVRIITKSGLYNYGIFQSKTDTSLLVFVENQKTSSLFYTNRIAEITVLSAPAGKKKYASETGTGNKKKTEYSSANQQSSSSYAARIAASEKAKENSAIFSRYLFAPSAIKHKKGTFVYDNSYGFINSLSYSASDYLSLTGGAELITSLMGQPILLFSPHIGVPVGDQLYLGGGYFYGAIVNTDNTIINALYGTLTWGNNNKNISVNLGSGINAGSSFSLNVSGYLKLNKNVALISENWFLESNEILDLEGIPLVGFGCRVFGEKVNFDFALINVVIPYVGFSYKF